MKAIYNEDANYVLDLRSYMTTFVLCFIYKTIIIKKFSISKTNKTVFNKNVKKKSSTSYRYTFKQAVPQ